MDTDKIKSVITEQLTELSDLTALKLENHIYGCYMIMQEIAEKDLSLSQSVLTKKTQNEYRFNLDQQFSQIGLRFGFVMDSHLLLDSYLPSYKQLWLEIFNDISLTLDNDLVDTVEEVINECIVQLRPVDKSFFFFAAENGYLPQECMDRVIDLIHPSLSYKNMSVGSPNITKSSTLANANTENKIHTTKFRKLNLTRRKLRDDLTNKLIEKVNKKHLAKTRRVHFK
jgi:hypothetical protein